MGYSFQTQLWAVLLEAIALYLCMVHVRWIFWMYRSFPCSIHGKIINDVCNSESKNKVLLLIQTYIRWQAMPQWHQCLWAAASKIMSYQSCTAICICVSSEEIQWIFFLAEWQCSIVTVAYRVWKFTEMTVKWEKYAAFFQVTTALGFTVSVHEQLNHRYKIKKVCHS